MATYRVISPRATWTPLVDAIKGIESAADAYAFLVDAKPDNSELGWRMEMKQTGGAFLR